MQTLRRLWTRWHVPGLVIGLLLSGGRAPGQAPGVPAGAAAPQLAFAGPAQGQFTFDTGTLRGVLHAGGKSFGLQQVTEGAAGKVLSKSAGWLSPYRVLSTGTQHGYAAWDWASQAERRGDGTVEVRWAANEKYPLDLAAVYRWTAPLVADLQVTVTPQRDLPRFELFVASYFEGFTQASVYARRADSEPPAFIPATKADGVWQVFPRDDAAAQLVRDGRWQHPPAPVTWQVRDRLAAPLAVRRSPDPGWTAAVMAPAADGFAVYTPYGEEGHGSLYLGLFGRDLPAGQPATARVRLVLGRGMTEEQAVKVYREYVAGDRPSGSVEDWPPPAEHPVPWAMELRASRVILHARELRGNTKINVAAKLSLIKYI